jgi:hypothetical protein
MIRRVAALFLLVTVLTGCFSGEGRQTLVSNPFGDSVRGQPTKVQHAPATEATALRVANLGQKVLQANPQLGLHPMFTTIGAPQEEIFHRETGEVLISEGLVKKCQNDGQLAALLCLELGKFISEREASASLATRMPERRPPPSVTIGNDSGGTFGPPDGTRFVELAKVDKEVHTPSLPVLPPPPPEVLARGYLEKAGFATSNLEEVAPLLRSAEANNTLEKQLTAPAAGRLPGR